MLKFWIGIRNLREECVFEKNSGMRVVVEFVFNYFFNFINDMFSLV